MTGPVIFSDISFGGCVKCQKRYEHLHRHQFRHLPGGPGQVTVGEFSTCCGGGRGKGGGCSAKVKIRVEKSDVGSVRTGLRLSLSLSYDKVTGFVDIPEFFVAESAEHSANERNVDFLAVKLADGTSVRFAAKFDTLHQATRGEGFLFL